MHNQKDKSLESAILHIIDQHYGGIKLIKLQTVLMTEFPALIEEIDRLEEIIYHMPSVQILKYTWHRMDREKIFVYTP